MFRITLTIYILEIETHINVDMDVHYLQVLYMQGILFKYSW